MKPGANMIAKYSDSLTGATGVMPRLEQGQQAAMPRLEQAQQAAMLQLEQGQQAAKRAQLNFVLNLSKMVTLAILMMQTKMVLI